MRIIFFILFSLPLYAYELSVCTIFQNDAKYLPEWIEFHQRQGVEHFYLYNNFSQDNYEEVLAPYIKSGLVELKDWPYDYKNVYEWNFVQCSSFLDCANRSNDKWIAFIDTDEFLFNPKKIDLRKLLKQYDKYSGVAVYWVMYGTSNTIVDENELIVDHLVLRSELSNPHNKQVKLILKPKDIESFVHPHQPILKPNKVLVGEDKKPFKNQHHMCGVFRINHYWSRDLDYFYNVKLPRRERWYNDRDNQIEWEKSFNIIYDPILSSFH
jgi:hypothetical protein